ncbi:MAG: putative aminohydrolase SsnA [Acidobacteria bacterium]|nr:putative aminohydrolase SsnA [Acidobacteriota bacterium]
MLILKNATILQFHPAEVRPGVDIAVEGCRIREVGPGIAAKYPEGRIMDLSGMFVSPGIVCSHNHFYSALARGILADIPPADNFVHQLQNLWWRLDRALDEESVWYSGLVGALEAVKAGVTAVVDHHASPAFITGSLSTLKRAFAETGLRGVLSYEVTDRNGEAGMEEGVRENADFLRSLAADRETPQTHLVEGAVGGHAPFTLNDRALGLMAEVVAESGRGVHVHVAEDAYDPAFSRHVSQSSPLARLRDARLLNDKALVVHGVFLSDEDLEILGEYDGFLLHNARSNMNNHVGYRRGLGDIRNVALGTDGIGSDMYAETQAAFFKNRDAGAGLWPGDFLRFLQNGNVILERYFGCRFGCVAPGFAADLTVTDYAPPTPLSADNVAGHFAFGMSARDVHTVIVNGRVVYENRRFPKDVSAVYAQAAEVAGRMWKRMNGIW